MTIDKHEIKDTFQQHCSIPPVLLDDLIYILDAEQLEVLKWIVEDAFESVMVEGEESGKLKYEEGYSDGYDAAMDAEQLEVLKWIVEDAENLE